MRRPAPNLAALAGLLAVAGAAAVIVGTGIPPLHGPGGDQGRAGLGRAGSPTAGTGGVSGSGAAGSGVAASGSAASGAAGSGSAGADSLGTPPPTPSVTLVPGLPAEAFRAPSIPWPLPDLDPTLAVRGPRPSLGQLATFLTGNKPIVSVDPFAGPDDWRLSRPDMAAVAGYADAVSVAPGGSFGLHLAGNDVTARIDVFRLGVGDAPHVLTVSSVPVAPRVVPLPDPRTGLDAMGWPTAYRVQVPADWRSGVYLAKLSARDGQSYVPFIVRPSRPSGLVVVLPMLTYQAYDSWNAASLYHWDGAPAGSPPRAYKVSFDRPFAWENGAGLLFRTELPLIVWLEDHGYSPGYIADVDLAQDAGWATGARTIVIAGHAEYWTASMRDAVLAAEARGVGVVAFGGNLAYWQVRLEPDRGGAPARTIVCYKDVRLDPVARTQPQRATVQFATLPTPEPASQLFGADYLGMVKATVALIVDRPMESFSPATGLRVGQRLASLLGGEIDGLVGRDRGVSLTRTPAPTSVHHVSMATASLWLSPSGAHVFDAGTFAWSWGLDPRYAAALPGFPAEAFARLTAEILAWAGTPPA